MQPQIGTMFSQVAHALGLCRRRIGKLPRRDAAGESERALQSPRLQDPNAANDPPACATLAQTHEVIDTMLKAMISASGWQTHGAPEKTPEPKAAPARAEIPVACRRSERVAKATPLRA